jgi:hypothetical protein
MMISEYRSTRSGLRAGFLALCILLSSLVPAAAAEAGDTPGTGVLHAEQWELSRHGDRILDINGIAETVRSWMTDPAQRIELQYPGGEEGELWVHELMDWLVALGVPSDRLVAAPGSGQEDIIRLQTIMTGERHR